SHIRYALTHRPPIVFDSLVKQFWPTATMRTLEAGPSKIIATIDGNEDGTHMPLLAPMLVVFASGDGAAAAAAGVAAANEDTPMREPTLVRVPTPVREPTPSPVREPTIFWEPTPDSPRPPSPPPYSRSEEVGPTTSTRPPSSTRQTSFQEDISKGGGDFVSSTKSNEAPPTTAATAAGENELGITKKVLGGAVLKLVSRVKRLEGLLQQRKRRLVLFDSEGEEAATKEQDIDLNALHRLASTKYFAVEDTIPAGDGIPADAQTIPAGSTPIPSSGGVSAGSSMDPPGKAAAAAPSSTILAADKGKAPMVDDSLHADLLTEQACILKNLHDYQLGEDLAKKLHAEQEAEYARQPDELAQKAQAKGVASLTEQGTGLSAQRQRELDAAQLIYNEADWLELMAKIATNSALSKQLLGDDVNEENMNERLGWTMKQVKALSIAQLKHEFQYIQRTLERSNLLNFKRTSFRPTPTLEAPSAKRARQEVPQDVHASVYAAPSIAAAVSVLTALSITTDVSVPAAPSIAADVSVSAAPSVQANIKVHADESRLDDTQTASEHVSTEHTVDESTPLYSRTHRKQVAKKWVTPLVDVADDALIKFDSANDSDDDPFPYAPFAGWEMNDLRKLLGVVDNLYQREEPDTFALILWGDLRDSWRIRSWCLYPRAQVHVLETVEGWVIYMFVDVSYPLSATTLKRMLKYGLEVLKLLVGGDLTMAEQLVRFINAALLNAQSAV
nr:hypothetical protein [Tanacetum cinerariifolium]